MTTTRKLRDPKRLPGRLAADLQSRIAAKEWTSGAQLPSEAVLVEEYGVSRSTVREALKLLESQGVVSIQHGRGSFVASDTPVQAGIQQLRSITDTIAEQGHRPGMDYHSAELRAATEEEAGWLELGPGDRVLALQRAVLADGIVVAYSYDRLPAWVLPRDFEPAELRGSTFEFLEQRSGVVAVRAIAYVHAVDSDEIAWGEDASTRHVYVLLDQTHYDADNRPVMHSKTYFIEGRFNFFVVRTAVGN